MNNLPSAIRAQPLAREIVLGPGEPEFGRREPGDTAIWFGLGKPGPELQRYPRRDRR